MSMPSPGRIQVSPSAGLLGGRFDVAGGFDATAVAEGCGVGGIAVVVAATVGGRSVGESSDSVVAAGGTSVGGEFVGSTFAISPASVGAGTPPSLPPQAQVNRTMITRPSLKFFPILSSIYSKLTNYAPCCRAGHLHGQWGAMPWDSLTALSQANSLLSLK
jgi:hypothetical protein